jgi:putative tributyrin esterase
MREGLVAQSLFSPSNRRRFEHWVWMPPGENRDLPLVVLLHGVYEAGGFCWPQNGLADLTAARLVRDGAVPPFCLVMPGDTGAEQGSGYCDWRDGTTLAETYVMRELLPALAEALPLGGRRHVAGLSMGGYGALLLALRHPGVFQSAGSSSGFFRARRLFHFVDEAEQRMWGDEAGTRAHDVLSLVRDAERRDGLRIALDCGTEDELIEDNREMHRLLDELRVPHGYVEQPGAHTWDYWTARLEHHLRFALGDGGDFSAGTPR